MIASMPNPVEVIPGSTTEQVLAALNQKIDALSVQIEYLTAQAQLAERTRQERAELTRDLPAVAQDILRGQPAPVQKVAAYTGPRDLIRLAKKLWRAAPYLERALDQLDGIYHLLEIAGSAGKESFARIITLLNELDRKGYYTFARGGIQIADNIVTSFTEEDVKRLGDNIVLILNVVKDMTQPEIMNFVRTTLALTEHEVQQPVDSSMPTIMAQMNDPYRRRGLALTMRVLRVVGVQATKKGKGAHK